MRPVLAPKAVAVEADTVAAEVEKGGAEVDMALAEEAVGVADENQTATVASNHRHSTTFGSTRFGCHSIMR
jgi:hypothetical protein